MLARMSQETKKLEVVLGEESQIRPTQKEEQWQGNPKGMGTTTANKCMFNVAIPCKLREKEGLFPNPVLWVVSIWKN